MAVPGHFRAFAVDFPQRPTFAFLPGDSNIADVEINQFNERSAASVYAGKLVWFSLYVSVRALDDHPILSPKMPSAYDLAVLDVWFFLHLHAWRINDHETHSRSRIASP